MSRIIALTGGIGSGKSSVATILQKNGAAIIDADEISRQLTAPQKAGSVAVRKLFGDAMFDESGALNRRRLREHVFGDSNALAQLNAALHPLIQDELMQQVAASARSHDLTVAVVPLLFETGWHTHFDEIWLVTADEPIRISRIVARDGTTPQQAASIIAAQMPDSFKIPLSTVIIPNNSSMQDLHSAVSKSL